MLKTLRPALVLFVILSAITGLAYPLLTTAWPSCVSASGQWQPDRENGQIIGSRLIGQNFWQPVFLGPPFRHQPASL
jgi:K+-transporting ATPase ATPase C chain